MENFPNEKSKLAQLEKALSENKAHLVKLMGTSGYTKENVEQIKSTPERIAALEKEIKEIAIKVTYQQNIIDTSTDINEKLIKEKINYESNLNELIKPLQELLDTQAEKDQEKHIKKISLQYVFDNKKAWAKIAAELYQHFSSEYGDSEREKEVISFIIDNSDYFTTNNQKEISDYLLEHPRNSTKFIKFLINIFKNEENFIIFQSIRNKHIYDVQQNKNILVEYDGRNINHASFGQKCTVVIVILTLFGNYPLIIDEPEAHLDSPLIANYLVPLLKNKKVDRQIIFATHNANFVINGDSEKIFILQNNSGKTEIIQTTIENTNYRKELLKLEGGIEAFKARSNKLDIK